MKQFTFLLAAVTLSISGCQPAPIVISNQGDNGHEHCRPSVIIERERPPVIIERQIICNAHRHCGCCPTCHSNGWVHHLIHPDLAQGTSQELPLNMNGS